MTFTKLSVHGFFTSRGLLCHRNTASTDVCFLLITGKYHDYLASPICSLEPLLPFQNASFGQPISAEVIITASYENDSYDGYLCSLRSEIFQM